MSGLQAVEGFVERVVPGVGKVMVSDSRIVPGKRFERALRREAQMSGVNKQIAEFEPGINLPREQQEAMLANMTPGAKRILANLKAAAAHSFYSRMNS